MTLGERISKLRKAKSLSQEELASVLDISRQAVYKWESDQSVPELEKLVALSNIFNVSLDELVKGNTPMDVANVEEVSSQVKTNDRNTMIGAIFLGLGALVSILLNILYGLLFISIGLVCLFAKKYAGLKCAWAAYAWFVVYMILATGINASMVRLTFQWTYEMNYVRLAFAWVMFILMAVMIVVTVRIMIKNPKQNDKDTIVIIVCAILFLAISFLPLGKIYESIPHKYINSGFVFGFFNIARALFSLIKTWLMIIILSKLIPTIKARLIKNDD